MNIYLNVLMFRVMKYRDSVQVYMMSGFGLRFMKLVIIQCIGHKIQNKIF